VKKAIRRCTEALGAQHQAATQSVGLGTRSQACRSKDRRGQELAQASQTAEPGSWMMCTVAAMLEEHKTSWDWSCRTAATAIAQVCLVP
jgi:hypothetical protein